MRRLPVELQYANALDRQDPDGVAALVTTDARVHAPDGDVMIGRAAVREHYRRSFAAIAPARHQLTLAAVKPRGSRIETTYYAIVILEGESGDEVRFGSYVFTLLRWTVRRARICEALIVLDRAAPLHALSAPAEMERQ